MCFELSEHFQISAIKCPFCSFQLPSKEEHNFAAAQDHFVQSHKALTAELPELDHEPLEIELGLGYMAPQASEKKTRDAVIVLTKGKDVFCVSVTHVQQSPKGPSLSSVVYKIYGEPGLITLATSSFKFSTAGLSTNVKLEMVLGRSHSSFCRSYEKSPRDFTPKEGNRLALSLSIFFGHSAPLAAAAATGTMEPVLKRQNGQMNLLGCTFDDYDDDDE